MRALKIDGVLMKFREDVQNMDKTCLKVNTNQSPLYHNFHQILNNLNLSESELKKVLF